MRASDLEALKEGDIQQDGDRVTIRFKAQKTQRWERLTLGAQALKYLDDAKKQHEKREAGDSETKGQHKDRETEDSRVFLLPSRAWSVKVVRAWGAAAGIPFNLGFHCGRHSFAVLSLQNGVDLYTLSKLMGHATITATQIYAKVVDETKTAAMDKLPSW